jgi:hypothetical protein
MVKECIVILSTTSRVSYDEANLQIRITDDEELRVIDRDTFETILEETFISTRVLSEEGYTEVGEIKVTSDIIGEQFDPLWLYDKLNELGYKCVRQVIIKHD